MKNYILLFITMSIMNSLMAQNFETVYDDQTTFYERTGFWSIKQYGYLKVDSVLNNGVDSIFYTKSHFDYSRTKCIGGHLYFVEDYKSPSFFGREILRKNDVDIYFNDNQDSIFFDYKAAIGESWKIMDLPDGGKVIGFITSIREDSLFGYIDSLKTIKLMVFDSLNNVISDSSAHQQELSIYQNHGWKIAPVIPIFPIFSKMPIVGHQELEQGIHNYSMEEINDIEIGSIMHMYNFEFCPGCRISYFSYDKLLILNNVIVNDTNYVTAQLDRVTRVDSVGIIDTIFWPLDTIVFKLNRIIGGYGDLSTFPYHSDGSIDSCGKGYHTRMDSENRKFLDNYYKYFITCNGLNPDTTYEISSLSSSNGWSIPSEKYYIKNFGGPYGDGYNLIITTNFMDPDISGGYHHSELVYAKNSKVEIGTPINIEDILNYTQVYKIKSLSIYPNPTTDVLKIEGEFEYADYRILSLDGQVVQSGIISGSQIQLSNKLPIGEYFLMIVADEVLYREPFVKF